jgi:hypothetical protein
LSLIGINHARWDDRTVIPAQKRAQLAGIVARCTEKQITEIAPSLPGSIQYLFLHHRPLAVSFCPRRADVGFAGGDDHTETSGDR